MRPTKMTTAECQDAVLEVALELARQDKRLAEIAEKLRLPQDADSMFESKTAKTTEVEVFGQIDYVKMDYLGPAIEALLAAAQVTDAALRIAFLRRPR